MCTVDYVRYWKRLSDNILETERVVSLKIISHDASFTYDHFTVPFLKTSITFLSLFLLFNDTRVFAVPCIKYEQIPVKVCSSHEAHLHYM